MCAALWVLGTIKTETVKRCENLLLSWHVYILLVALVLSHAWLSLPWFLSPLKEHIHPLLWLLEKTWESKRPCGSIKKATDPQSANSDSRRNCSTLTLHWWIIPVGDFQLAALTNCHFGEDIFPRLHLSESSMIICIYLVTLDRAFVRAIRLWIF